MLGVFCPTFRVKSSGPFLALFIYIYIHTHIYIYVVELLIGSNFGILIGPNVLKHCLSKHYEDRGFNPFF